MRVLRTPSHFKIPNGQTMYRFLDNGNTVFEKVSLLLDKTKSCHKEEVANNLSPVLTSLSETIIEQEKKMQ